jgi:hypothetical protein
MTSSLRLSLYSEPTIPDPLAPTPTVTAGKDANNSPSQTIKPINNRNIEAMPTDNNNTIKSNPEPEETIFLNAPHGDDIFTNKHGYKVIYNLNKKELPHWYSLPTNNWQQLTKQYKWNFEPFIPAECASKPGQRGFKNAHLVLTRLITKDAVKHPTTIQSYIDGIKEVWDDQGTLQKTQKRQKLRKFIMQTTSTWPLDFFLQDWDNEG